MAGHEPGPFSSVRRPRETLGPINQNASAIPMPSSAMKRSNSVSNMQPGAYPSARAGSVSGQRMSLAPGRPPQPNLQRTSSGSNLADMGISTVQRSSSGNMFSSTNGRKSLAPGGFSTPAHSLQPNPMQQSTQRRSSVYSARQSSSMAQIGHQSFFTQAPVPAGVPKDPRPLRDRSFQTQIGQELLDYLTHNNFEMDMKHSLTQNTMRSPTQKDFNYMFQWLYHRVDPNYRFQKDIPAEVPPILKQLRYPFEKNITKSQLSAVGGNNWPTFLGMLHWMMQLARMMDGFNAGTYDDACIEAGYDISGDRIVFNFLSGAYHEWLAMEDDQDDKEVLKPHVDELAAKFDAANARYLEQVKMLEAENKSLEDQIEELDKSGPKIRKLDEDIKVLEDDLNKFETYRNEVESRLPSRKTKIEMLESEITKVESELEEAQKAKAELQEAVDKQGIAITDIDRMNAESERLQRGIDGTAERLEESKRKVSDKENDAASRLDTLERTVHEYNSLGYQLSMIPSTATNAKGQEYELSLQVNSTPDFRSSRTRSSEAPDQDQHQPDRLLADPSNGYVPQHLLNLDVRGAVKNGIVALRKEVSARRNAAAEADMGNRDMLDGIKEAIEDKMQEVEGLRHRVRGAEEEFEKTREMQTTQKLATDAQTEKLEKELARMRTTLTESVQLMEQREMNTNIEYEQLTLRAAALREELHTNVEKMLNDVIRFKVHVQKALEEYEGFVAGEVESEWGALEGAGEDTNTAGFATGEGGENTRNFEDY